MAKDTITVDEMVDYLNHLAQLDQNMIFNLLTTLVDCNEDIQNHSSVQTDIYPGVGGEPDVPVVGLMGIINGMFPTIQTEENEQSGQIGYTTDFEDMNNWEIRFVKLKEKE